jgi:hypothetical protein
MTWSLAFFLPALSTLVLRRFQGIDLITSFVLASAFQMCLTATCWFLLQRNLRQRKFIAGEAT